MKHQWAFPALLLSLGVCPLAGVTETPRLRLRAGPIPDNLLEASSARARSAAAVQGALTNPGRSHLILQFAEPPGESIRREVESRQIRVLAYVPDNALLVSAPLDARLSGLGLVYAGALSVENKFSALLGQAERGENTSAVVELHADVDPADGWRMAVDAGLEITTHPDLPSYALLVQGSVGQLEELAGHDEVAWVYPASEDLLSGRPATACRGGAQVVGADDASPMAASASLASSFGEGWDGPGLGSASLTYYLGRMSPALDAQATRAEIVRALQEWSNVVRLTFSESGLAKQKRQLDIEFSPRSHGDGQDFDGRGGILAHTFYPPPNAETVAGDLHFDMEEQWRIGNDVDVFSVALHELGHSLGLGHSDNPDAVMYPYYRRSTMLHQPDVVEIRRLYAATGSTPPSTPTTTPPTTPTTTPPTTPTTTPTVPTAPAGPTTPSPAEPATPVPSPAGSGDKTPPTVTITAPSVATISTRSASYSIRGRVSDDVQVKSVTWTNSNGTSGKAAGLTAFATDPIPLALGQNRVVVTATDTAGNAAWRAVTITRR